MTTRLALLALAAACAGRQGGTPEPVEPPVLRRGPADGRTDPAKPEPTIRQVSTPSAPDLYDDPKIAELIARIDPHEYERWPLTPNQHPALEPAYPIARVFADPTVSWLDLCRMGAQNRRGAGNPEQLEYLRAWCEVAKHDAAAAVTRLRPLLNSSVLGLPSAARTDIANIVVDAGGADVAQDALTRAQVDDLTVYDLVAAGYVEVGRIPDAIELTDRGIDAHDQRHPLEHCMRIARKVVLVAPSERTPLLVRLDTLPRCGGVYAELMCWHKRHCDPYLLANGITHDKLPLGEVYKAWPKPGASTDEWLAAARSGWKSYGRGSEEATLRAIVSGLRSVSCTGPRVRDFIRIADDLATFDNNEAEARLSAIIATPATACARD